MLSFLAGKVGWQVALAVVQKYWKPILFGGIGLATLGYIAYLRWDNSSLQTDLTLAEQRYEQAERLNKENAKVVAKLNKEAALDRQIQALEADRQEKATTKVEAIRKELNELPSANDRVSSHRDELAKRLRELSAD